MQPGWHKPAGRGPLPWLPAVRAGGVGGWGDGDLDRHLIQFNTLEHAAAGELRRGREIIKRLGPYKCALRWHRRDWIWKRRAKKSKAKRNTNDWFHSSDRSHWWGMSYFNVFWGRRIWWGFLKFNISVFIPYSLFSKLSPLHSRLQK